MESRLLLSFASLSAHGTLSVVGTNNNDSIVVKFNGAQVQAILNGQTQSFNKSDVKRIFAKGLAGDDRISNQTSRPSTLVGDAGNDSLTGGTGNDSLDGGDGNDTADYSSRTAPITAELQIDQSNPDIIAGVGGFGGQSGEHDVYRSISTVVGGSGNDSLSVQEINRDSGPNIVGQSFLLDGRNGNDSFNQNSVESVITSIGGNGNDRFSFFNISKNTLIGGPGNDLFTNNSDDDATASIDAGSGYDTEEYGGIFPDTVHMGPGLEKMIASGISVAGNDLNNLIIVKQGFGGGNYVHGGGGNDTINASADPDPLQLFGDNGNDSVIGGSGNDTIHGGSGNDTVDGGLGSDDLFGDGGTDTADYSHRTENLRLSLDNVANDGASGEGDNIHADVENILGGSGNDFIQGNPFANKLVGNAGNDTIFGGDGNDTLIGGPGNDLLDGQGGTNVIIQ
jgi:Ca2+-binding RTX toxin-like protein